MQYIYILSALLSLCISIVLLLVFIPILRSVKLGQKILDVGPRWHAPKAGTPIMGGLFFGAAALAGTALAYFLMRNKHFIADDKMLFASVVFIVINFLSGFLDDYIKLFKKRNEGLTAKAKLAIQFVATAVYVFAMHSFGFGTELFIPFVGNVDFGFFYYPIIVIGIMYLINCVNLTDGIDGLAGSVTFVEMLFFSFLALGTGSMDSLVISVPMAAALVGFLIFNVHPAKIFMGDTGSLMLGATVVALACMQKMPLILVICGFVYVFEGITVMLQVASYKLTGKRIFKMSPFHHHLELCDWSEYKIVVSFSLASAVLCVIAYFGSVPFIK